MKNTATFPAPRSRKRYTQIFEYMFVFSKGTPAVANLICDKPNKWAGTSNWGKQRKDRVHDNFIIKPKARPIPEFSPRTNAWTYVIGKGHSKTDSIAYEHPAIFPEPLAEDHIITWTNPGQIVYDCFLGSGTVAKIAQKLGRFWIGSEINPAYEYIIKERLKNV